MDTSRKNWAQEYEVKQEELRECYLKNKIHRLMLESENEFETIKKLWKLEEAKKVFETLNREAFEYNKEDEDYVDERINELWKELESKHKEDRDYESWREYQEEEQNRDDNVIE